MASQTPDVTGVVDVADRGGRPDSPAFAQRVNQRSLALGASLGDADDVV
jgi:hypothetical protein